MDLLIDNGLANHGWLSERVNDLFNGLAGDFERISPPVDVVEDHDSYHFSIDLTHDRGDAMDTPYAQYSRWGFRLIPIWDDATGCESSDIGSYAAGCQWYPWELTYTLKVVGAGHSTAGGVTEVASK